MPSPALARRSPVQRRGVERVGAILDAAAAVLEHGGWEALNTNALARRARIPVGSVYQYFPNKEAVVHALARRSLGRLEALVAGLMPSGAFDWERLVERFIDALARFWREEPGYRAGWMGAHVAAGVAEAERALDRELAGQVGELLRRINPRQPKRRREEAALALVIAVGPLLANAARLPPAQAAGLEREAKLLVKCRLRLCVEEGR